MKKIFSKLLVFTLLTVSTTSLVACGSKKCEKDPHNVYSSGDELLETTYVNGKDCLGGIINHYKCKVCGEEYTIERDNDKHNLNKLIQNSDEYNVGCIYCDRPSLYESFTVTNPSQRVTASVNETASLKYYDIEVSNTEVAFHPILNSTYSSGFGGEYDFSIKASIKVNKFQYTNDHSSSWYIPCHIKFSVGDTVIGEYETCASFSNSGDTMIGDYNSTREDEFNVEGTLAVKDSIIYSTSQKTNDQIKVECTVLSARYGVDSLTYYYK